MKKKLIGAVALVAIVAIVAMAAFSLNLNTENNELPALTLDNVEALASGESGGGGRCYQHCKLKLNYICLSANGKDHRGYKCGD